MPWQLRVHGRFHGVRSSPTAEARMSKCEIRNKPECPRAPARNTGDVTGDSASAMRSGVRSATGGGSGATSARRGLSPVRCQVSLRLRSGQGYEGEACLAPTFLGAGGGGIVGGGTLTVDVRGSAPGTPAFCALGQQHGEGGPDGRLLRRGGPSLRFAAFRMTKGASLGVRAGACGGRARHASPLPGANNGGGRRWPRGIGRGVPCPCRGANGGKSEKGGWSERATGE